MRREELLEVMLDLDTPCVGSHVGVGAESHGVLEALTDVVSVFSTLVEPGSMHRGGFGSAQIDQPVIDREDRVCDCVDGRPQRLDSRDCFGERRCDLFGDRGFVDPRHRDYPGRLH